MTIILLLLFLKRGSLVEITGIYEKYQELISSEEGIGKFVQKMITEQTKFVELSDAFETAYEDMKKVYEWKIVLNEKEVDFFKNWLRVSQYL